MSLGPEKSHQIAIFELFDAIFFFAFFSSKTSVLRAFYRRLLRIKNNFVVFIVGINGISYISVYADTFFHICEIFQPCHIAVRFQAPLLLCRNCHSRDFSASILWIRCIVRNIMIQNRFRAARYNVIRFPRVQGPAQTPSARSVRLRGRAV